MAGYVFSEHIFGRSSIKRSGKLFYLKWQSHNKTDINKVILLTQKQYRDIKQLLGPIIKEEVDGNYISYYHKVTKRSYNQIRKYMRNLKYAAI